jgi:hypothetical protein
VKPLTLALLLCGAFSLTAAAQDMTVYDDALENGWQDYGWATLNFANTKPIHSGSDSISVVDPGTSFEALFLGHAAFNPSPYQSLSFWVYPTVAGTSELVVQATLNGAAQPAVKVSFTAAEVSAWQQITIPLSTLGVANNATFNGFWIQNNSGGPLTFYVDDISLIAVAPPNPVPLSVNPQSVIRTIDSRTYGMNIVIWDNLLRGAATSGLLAAMQTGAFRFPGGSASDQYNWQTNLSIPNGTYFWPNNAATFAGITGSQAAQAYVTVNYGSGTPQQAAAWVAYYNAATSSTTALATDSMGRNWNTAGYWASLRAAAPLKTDDGYNFLRIAHPAPFNILYWEIGNECYGNWEYDLHGMGGSGLSGAAHDPYTYAQSFQSYYNQMVAVDPAIHIGAVAVPGEDAYGIGTHAVANPLEGNSLHTGWTPVMLATLKSLGVTPGFLIDHNYPQNPGSESDSVLLQDSATLVSDATNLRQLITDYIGATPGSSIELAVTELNSVSSGPGKQTTSVVNGLFYADAIATLAATEFKACTWWALRGGADTTANNSASLYGWREYGDYGVVSSGDVSGTPANTPYPAYYAAQLLTNWGRGGSAVVSATSGYALLSIHAAQLLNGNLALLVINKHPTAGLPAQITLDNFTPGSVAAPFFSYGKPNDLAGGGLTTGTASITGATFTYTFPSYSMTVLIVKSQFENWREQNFTAAQLGNWAFSGDNGQPAEDGISNLMKYALGLNPNKPALSGLPIPGQVTIAGKTYPTLTFTDQSALTDITYKVEDSTDLQTWQSGPLYTVRTDNGSTNTATYRDLTAIQDAPRHFMRLTITRQ